MKAAMSIVLLTGRREPRLDWLVEAILRQADPRDEIELIVVDALHDERGKAAPHIVDARVAEALGRGGEPTSEPWVTDVDLSSPLRTIRLVPPKPTIWQGKYRVVDRDWWAASSGRNTGICLASHDYLCFLDDRAKPGPKWLATIRAGALGQKTAVIAGSYDKLEGPLDQRHMSPDHRRGISPRGKVDCGGSWLYGCTLCLPLEWALAVNGFEEGCDSLTGEDYMFGLMLSNAGYRIDFDPDLYVLLDREPGDASMKGRYVCTDKGKSPHDKSHAAIKRFGSRKRTEFTPDLRELRRTLRDGGVFPVPDPDGDYRDWYDGEDIRKMTPR